MDLLPDLLQVVGRLGERVRLAVEVVEGLGPVDLGREQVVEVEPELLGELADLGVALVDQLAAVLGDLALGEVAPARPAAPAERGRRPRRARPGVAGALEPVGAGQPGQAAADDDDPGALPAARAEGSPLSTAAAASPAPPASSWRRVKPAS